MPSFLKRLLGFGAARTGASGRRVLLAGPWVGEFGFEICQWQALLRRMAKNFDHVTVVTYPGHEGMYQDFTQDVRQLPPWFLERRLEPNELGLLEADRSIVRRLRKELASTVEHTEQLVPTRVDIGCHEQDWATWRRPKTAVVPNLIALVRRRRTMSQARNWNDASWTRLAEALRARGLQVAEVPANWSQSLELFSHCALAVGSSTGGLHLASLCGCPHFVWGNMGFLKHARYDLSARYQSHWNPLQTPVLTADTGWAADFDTVLNGVLAAYEKIGRLQAITNLEIRISKQTAM